MALEHLGACGSPREVRTAVLHHKIVSPFVPDYFARRLVRWRWIIYPWAVIEDLSARIRNLPERPATPLAIARRLETDHGIRVPLARIEDVLDLRAGELGGPVACYHDPRSAHLNPGAAGSRRVVALQRG